MRSFILSQWRERKTGVMWQDLGDLTTARARELWKVVRYLSDKNQNYAWLSRSRYCTDRAQNLLGPAQTVCSECCRFHPNRFTFGEVIRARVNAVKTGNKAFPIFGWGLATSRIIIGKFLYFTSLVWKCFSRPFYAPFTQYYRLSIRVNNRWTTAWVSVYTMQQVVQPVEQPVVSCKQGIRSFFWAFDP